MCPRLIMKLLMKKKEIKNKIVSSKYALNFFVSVFYYTENLLRLRLIMFLSLYIAMCVCDNFSGVKIGVKIRE